MLSGTILKVERGHTNDYSIKVDLIWLSCLRFSNDFFLSQSAFLAVSKTCKYHSSYENVSAVEISSHLWRKYVLFIVTAAILDHWHAKDDLTQLWFK